VKPSFGSLLGEPIAAYFTLLMVGFATATWLLARWARRSDLDREVIIDLGLVSVLAGVAGGRILHVFADGYFWDYVHLCTDPSQVIWRVVETAHECKDLGGAWDVAAGHCHAVERNCFAWAEFWNGGLAYYGGLGAAVIAGLWFLRREGFPVLATSDAAATVIPIGIFFGRMGCFFSGCCFGKVTHGPLGLVFPPFSAASEMHFREGLLPSKGLESLPVHATQLYEAAGSLAIAFAMAWVLPRKRFDGQVLLLFLAAYAVLRFVLEYLRADDRGGLGGISTSQIIGVAILGAVAVMWPRLAARAGAGQDANA
jgi:phosphatidylglycerol:prolipoprotein diacylglycerol transferase